MNRLGVIGKPSDWLIASNVDYAKAKSVFDIDLIDINIDELISIYNECSSKTDEYICKIAAEPQYFSKNGQKSEEINKAYILYFAIKELAKRYNLSGLTIRCFDLLSKLTTTSCLAFSLLNSEGIIATCEGDVPSMITMYLIYKYCDKTSFQSNPAQVMVEENSMILAHCTIPRDMCNHIDLDTHFESGIGIGIKGYLEEKEVSILKINSNLDKYILLKGHIVENLKSQKLCRTQIKIKFLENNDVSYFLKRPLGNHHIVFYGHDTSKLETILKQLKRIF